MQRTALVVGVTGIGGNHVARELLAGGWNVVGLSRRAPKDLPGVRHVAADLLDPAALSAALAGIAPTHVFITTWMRQETEQANIRVRRFGGKNVPYAGKAEPAVAV